jgi:hypothetical protein
MSHHRITEGQDGKQWLDLLLLKADFQFMKGLQYADLGEWLSRLERVCEGLAQ